MQVVEDNGQTLQSLIAGKAYDVIEKYTKYEQASELIKMLSNIAAKQKTIVEIIENAHDETIINMVNKADEN